VSRLRLICSSDDYLLAEAVADAVAEICAAVDGVEAEKLSEQTTPEALAVEICYPSLFSSQRLLVIEDVRSWLDASPPPGVPRSDAKPEVEPLIVALGSGVPDGVAVVLGAWCGGRPKGELVELVERCGQVEWIPLPERPKPWEDVALSEEQEAVLLKVLRRAVPEVRLTPAAERLLLERLGFAPRLLAQEAVKLAAAAGEGGEVDEDLVRSLTFPRERSLEVVRDAVLKRDHAPVADLIAAAVAGVPVRDWRGQRLDSTALALILLGQVAQLLEQLLYLRRVALATGLGDELDPDRTAARGWYPSRFKRELGPVLVGHLRDDPEVPLGRDGRMPSLWSLGNLFAAAGRYPDETLVSSLAVVGELDVQVRGPLALESVSAWLAEAMGAAGSVS
jgi:hypothetical protein